RQTPPVSSHIRSAMLDSPGNGRVTGYAHTVCVGNDNGSFQKTALLHPRGASHFAVPVQAEHACVNRIVQRIVTARNDSCYTRAHRTFADFEFAFTGDQG